MTNKKIIKKPSWKQNTPKMQLVLFLQSIWGNADNTREGIGDSKKQLEKILVEVENIKELLPFLEEGSWPEDNAEFREYGISNLT